VPELTAARRWSSWLGAGAIGLAVALAGCGGSGSGGGSSPAASRSAPAAEQHVTISGTSGLRFQPMTVRVHAGAVRVTLRDMGTYPHDIVIPALGVTSATVTGDPGSGSVSFTVRFQRAGRYRFHCQYHASAGMVGVFVVS
jgi:plastocyanin